MLPLPILVTGAVWDEVAGDLTRPGAQALQRARDQGLLEVIQMGDREAYGLGIGENATLSAAAIMRAAVIIDERKARRLVETDPELRTAVPARLTTVALVVRAKREGLVQAVRPVLDELLREGFYISRSVYRDALQTAGELE